MRAQPDVASVFAIGPRRQRHALRLAEGPRRGPRPHQHRIPPPGRARGCRRSPTRASSSAIRTRSAAATSRSCSPAPIPPSCSAAALTLVEQMRQRPELRAPRIAGDLQAARDHDPAAAQPDGRHGRHHRRDEPGDPRRHAGRDRSGQRPLLAQRPAGADPGRRSTRARGAISRRSRTCRCRRERRLGPAQACSPKSASAPARLVNPAHQSAAPGDRRRRSRRRAWSTRRRSSPQLPIMQNLPEGVERARSGPAARGRRS